MKACVCMQCRGKDRLGSISRTHILYVTLPSYMRVCFLTCKKSHLQAPYWVTLNVEPWGKLWAWCRRKWLSCSLFHTSTYQLISKSGQQSLLQFSYLLVVMVCCVVPCYSRRSRALPFHCILPRKHPNTSAVAGKQGRQVQSLDLEKTNSSM